MKRKFGGIDIHMVRDKISFTVAQTFLSVRLDAVFTDKNVCATEGIFYLLYEDFVVYYY